MDQEIHQQIRIATGLVQKWPAWKQNILVQSGQPTVKVPRTPLNIQKATSEWREGDSDSLRS